jgi:hypothetical protein
VADLKRSAKKKSMTTTQQAKTIRKSLSLILAAIGVIIAVADISSGGFGRAPESFHVPAGLPLVAIGAMLYFLRKKEEQALR